MQTQTYGSSEPMNYETFDTDDIEEIETVDMAVPDTVRVRDKLSYGAPSHPLLGVLPLSRIIPQDVHSVADYANGVTTGAGFFLCSDPRAKVASAVLGASVIGVSLLTDYRLSAFKVVPIEAHEAIDHIWGASAILAPFVLGYWKTAPKVALSHIVSGASTILASLFTDYRSVKRVA
jgi:hypothetical protein